VYFVLRLRGLLYWLGLSLSLSHPAEKPLPAHAKNGPETAEHCQNDHGGFPPGQRGGASDFA
jgi:hypothetical protein